MQAAGWNEKKASPQLSKEAYRKLEKAAPHILITRIEALMWFFQTDNCNKTPLFSLGTTSAVVVDNAEAIGSQALDATARLISAHSGLLGRQCQKIIVGQNLPAAELLQAFSHNTKNTLSHQSGNKVIMLHDECWMDAKLDESLTASERHQALRCKVYFES